MLIRLLQKLLSQLVSSKVRRCFLLSCIFCQIVNKKIFADIVYEDDNVLAFKDIEPQAPVHLLVIPKQHIESLDDMINIKNSIISDIFNVIYKLAKDYNLGSGFRVITNYGKDAGQTVNHLHFHLLGKKLFDNKF
ncbi:MAG: histidine triad nucleotide-binding protein [Oscillospiraceae bacterium]|nr:histidine triad nucleotide-binding protein [Oscillospiraceae bacterium]